MSNKDVEYTKGVKRYEDMSPSGFLRLLRQDDGDVIIEIAGEDFAGRERRVSVEFCTSGGQSHNTLIALCNLIDAIKKDNMERPQHRIKGDE